MCMRSHGAGAADVGADSDDGDTAVASESGKSAQYVKSQIVS